MSSDDTTFLLFLGVGIVIVVLIIVLGIRSSRKKRTATTATWTMSVKRMGTGEPFLSSSPVEMADARQWELWQQEFPLGSALTVTLGADQDGAETTRTLHIARVARELRAGWPKAALGFSAYFAEFEHAGLPCELPVRASNRIVALELTETGVSGRDDRGSAVWSCAWPQLVFSNGSDLILSNGAAQIRVARGDRYDDIEEIVAKYGTLRQMHF